MTREDLARGGVDVTRIGERVRAGEIVRLRRGVYMDGPTHEGLHPAERAVVGILAYGLAARGPVVFSHASAARLHGFAVLAEDSRVHVLSPTSHGSGMREICIHRGQSGNPVRLHGVGATDREQTLLDCARTMPLRQSLGVLESALHGVHAAGDLRRGDDAVPAAGDPLAGPSEEPGQGAETAADPASSELARLRGIAAEEQGRGWARARRVLEIADVLSESPGESLVKLVTMDAGLSAPRQQYPIGPFRVDFAWEEFRVVLEFDGAVKYADDAQAAEAVRRERERQVQITNAGWIVIRTGWHEVLHRPWDLVDKLRAAGVR